MPKRKSNSDDDEDAESSSHFTDEEVPRQNLKKSTAATRRAQKQKKQVINNGSDEGDSDGGAPPAKKNKTEKKVTQKKALEPSGSDLTVKSTPDGEKYIDLGKKKRATVRSFKGIALLDIREYYDAGGVEKPGKKGISLQLEQWESLKQSSETIDKLISALDTKK